MSVWHPNTSGMTQSTNLPFSDPGVPMLHVASPSFTKEDVLDLVQEDSLSEFVHTILSYLPVRTQYGETCSTNLEWSAPWECECWETCECHLEYHLYHHEEITDEEGNTLSGADVYTDCVDHDRTCEGNKCLCCDEHSDLKATLPRFYGETDGVVGHTYEGGRYWNSLSPSDLSKWVEDPEVSVSTSHVYGTNYPTWVENSVLQMAKEITSNPLLRELILEGGHVEWDSDDPDHRGFGEFVDLDHKKVIRELALTQGPIPELFWTLALDGTSVSMAAEAAELLSA